MVLINSILTSLPMLLLSFFRNSKGVLKKLDYYRSRFFWQNEGHKKSIGWHDGIFCALQNVLKDWESQT